MLFTQFNMDDALAVRYEEGVEDGKEIGKAEGRSEGKAEGRSRILIHQVCGKLQKGEPTERIAADLLVDEEEVVQICEAYGACGADENAVFDRLMSGREAAEDERRRSDA